MSNRQRISRTAWEFHRTGRTEQAVAMLEFEISGSEYPHDVEPLAYNLAQILIDAGRGTEAERGLRDALQFPPGSAEPEIPSAELMECLFTAMAIGGQEFDLAVVRWLLLDCQDRGRWQEALNFAAILISYLTDSSPVEARELAHIWRTEAKLLGEEGHVRGLTEIIRKIEEKKPD